jgi:PII-like signaling protein
VTVVVDSPARIAESFAIVDELTDQVGLVTWEMVGSASLLTPPTGVTP